MNKDMLACVLQSEMSIERPKIPNHVDQNLFPLSKICIQSSMIYVLYLLWWEVDEKSVFGGQSKLVVGVRTYNKGQNMQPLHHQNTRRKLSICDELSKLVSEIC
ncbi:hypothetical protein ACTXT7_002576 [Hymenolepis weldensis]